VTAAEHAKPYWLREVTEHDIDFMFEVKRSGLREYVEATWGPWNDVEQRARFITLITPQYDRIIVTHDGDVGTLCVTWDTDPAFLAGIYLATTARGPGLGSAIIGDIQRRARELARSVQLRVLRTNAPARRLYERLGFLVLEESDTHFLMRWSP
jgi:ribosomal protein S18 acetylase RimI-like enzyme